MYGRLRGCTFVSGVCDCKCRGKDVYLGLVCVIGGERILRPQSTVHSPHVQYTTPALCHSPLARRSQIPELKFQDVSCQAATLGCTAEARQGFICFLRRSTGGTQAICAIRASYAPMTTPGVTKDHLVSGWPALAYW